MKKKFLVAGILAGALFSATPVMAKGNATIEFAGVDNVVVGETFKVYMNVKDVENTYDGVVSLGGNISFDETKIEYVSSKTVESPYLFQINEKANYKIAGLDFTLSNGIFNDLTVYEFTFKAIDEGNATVTIVNQALTDSLDYIDTSVIAKNIEISEKQDIEVIEEATEDVDAKNEDDFSTEEDIETEEIEETKDIEIENVSLTNYQEKEDKTNIFKRINNYMNKFFKNIFKIFR